VSAKGPLRAFRVETNKEISFAHFASGVVLAEDMHEAMRLAELSLGGKATSASLIGTVIAYTSTARDKVLDEVEQGLELLEADCQCGNLKYGDILDVLKGLRR
jgi:hypothetical protein